MPWTWTSGGKEVEMSPEILRISEEAVDKLQWTGFLLVLWRQRLACAQVEEEAE